MFYIDEIHTLKNFDPYHSVINLTFTTDYNNLGFRTITMPVGDLIDDWFEECRYCPENDATILQGTIYIEEENNKPYPIILHDKTDLITFEYVMQSIYDCWFKPYFDKIYNNK